MKTALKVYNELCDMDFLDYVDTIENDLNFIYDLLKDHTESEILEILSE